MKLTTVIDLAEELQRCSVVDSALAKQASAALKSTVDTILDLSKELVVANNRHAAIVHALSATATQLRLATAHVSVSEGAIQSLQESNAELISAAIAVQSNVTAEAISTAEEIIDQTSGAGASATARLSRMINLVEALSSDLKQVCDLVQIISPWMFELSSPM
jgi:primase-polymerase (primpol)-like protein